MVLVGIIMIIFMIAFSSSQISSLLIIRISALICIYSLILSYNSSLIIENNILFLYNGLFIVSDITLIIDSILAFIAILILLINPKGLNIISEYGLISLFSLSGIIMLISSNDLVSFYLSLELQSFGLYILSTIYRESEAGTFAGLKYFLLGSLSSALILLGSALIYSLTGLTNFQSLYLLGSSFTSFQPFEFSIILIIIGLLFKIAAAPLHNWSPDVYDGVPTIVTTWIAVLPKIALIIFINQLNGFSLLINWSSWTTILLISSLLSLIVGTIGGLSQYRLKRLLAFSAISHVGFILLAIAINDEQGLESLYFYIIQYSLSSLAIFYIIIAFGSLVSIPTRYSPVQFINQLKGQLFYNPLLSISLALSLFSIAGIPPLIGFFGKQIILTAALQSGLFFITIIAILTSVISTTYYLRVIKVINFDTIENIIKESQIKSEIKINNNQVLDNITSSIITGLIFFQVLFILNPIPLLNSVHLLALNTIY